MNPKDSRGISFKEVDWKVVNRALLAYAAFLAGGKAKCLEAVGDSPEDVVAEIIRRFLDPRQDRPTWNAKRFGKATTASVIGFLKPVLKNFYWDLFRKSARRIQITQERGGKPAARQPELSELIDRLERIDRQAKIEDDAEVELYTELLLYCLRNGDKPPANESAAAEMGLQASDVVNIKKRMRRMALRGDS